jgi:hypothetical protein
MRPANHAKRYLPMPLMILAAERQTAPRFLRCDNGPELTANVLRDWCRFNQAGTSYIEPGSPWQNPYVESFGGRLRDELLSVEAFNLCWRPRCWSRTGGSSTTRSGPITPRSDGPTTGARSQCPELADEGRHQVQGTVHVHERDDQQGEPLCQLPRG